MKQSAQNVQGAIWLIGIGILLLTHLWWPGILILVGISMIAGSMMRDTSPVSPAAPPVPAPLSETPVEVVDSSFSPEPIPGEPIPPPVQHYDTSNLPATCMMCGGPVKAGEVKWADPDTPLCSFCGAKLIVYQPNIKAA